jgi:type I restriction enzyme S subunit
MMEKKLPNSWVEIHLIELLESLETGTRPKGGVQGILDGIPSVGGEHLNSDGGFKFDNIKYVPFKFAASMNRGKIKKNDILIVKDGATTGKTSFVDISFPFEYAFVNEHVFLCRSSKLINSKCLYYFLRSKTGQDRVMSNFAGAAQGGINTKFSHNTLVSLPPLPEQQRIVAKLDTLFGQLDKIKTHLERIPQLLKDFRQSVLTQAVIGKLTEEWRKGRKLKEWKIASFGDLMLETPKNGAYFPRNLYGSGTKIIRIDNFYDGALKDWELVQKVRISKKDIEAYKIEEGDILINRVNSIEYLGKCMLVEDLPESCIYESNMMRVKVDKTLITPNYAKLFLISKTGLSELRKNAKHAVNQASINQQDVKSVEFNFPSLTEQQEIVNRVESLFAKADKIETQYQTLKEKIGQLPQAILAKAFRGELVEQLPTDGDARVLLEEIKRVKAGLEKGGKSRKLRGDEANLAAEPRGRYGK